MDSRLRRSPPDRASAVPYGQAGENAMRFPRLAHRSAAAHKLHSTPQQDRMNLISGKGETSSRLPALAYSSPEAVQTTGTVAVIDQLDAGDVLLVTRLDRLARIDARPVKHARGDRRSQSRCPIARRRTGRHHHSARPFDDDRPRRLGRVRERVDPRPHRRGTRAGQSVRRQDGPQAETDRSNHQKSEAIRRRDIDGEPVREIARSYNAARFHGHRVMRVQLDAHKKGRGNISLPGDTLPNLRLVRPRRWQLIRGSAPANLTPVLTSQIRPLLTLKAAIDLEESGDIALTNAAERAAPRPLTGVPAHHGSLMSFRTKLNATPFGEAVVSFILCRRRAPLLPKMFQDDIMISQRTQNQGIATAKDKQSLCRVR